MGAIMANMKWILGGLLIGYMAKDQLNVFFEGLKNKAVGAIPTTATAPAPMAPVIPGQVAPQPPVAGVPTGQVPVRQALAGESLYPGAFPPQDYDAQNEYYGVAYPAEASSILVPGRRFDRDYTKYNQADVNSIPALW